MPVDLSDYNTVAMRIAEFRQKHPHGSLRPVNPDKPFEVIEVGGKTFVTYIAAAYRTPDDPMPGIGVAWEPFPGRTPYTRDSELMNAETSGWGRAIVAVLAADTVAGIASAEEVQNRRAEDAQKPAGRSSAASPNGTTPAAPRAAANASDAQVEELRVAINAAKDAEALNTLWKAAGSKGALQAETVDPATGVKGTIQELLYQRNDAIKSQQSDPGPQGRKPAAKK